MDNSDMHPIYLYTDKRAYSDLFPEVIRPVFCGIQKNSRVHFDGTLIKPKKVPKGEVMTQNLMNRMVEDMEAKFPLTEYVFKCMRDYAEDEEIRDYAQL